MFESKQFLFTSSAPVVTPKVYGVKIALENSNPATALTYTDDAIGVTDWTIQPIFKDIKPCLLKNGVVQYYLNPNDFSKKLDGTDSDITNGNDGDVMIEIPKFAYMLYNDVTYQYVKITNSTNAQSIDSRFHYYAHTRDTEGDRENLYIGAYLGYNLSSQLRSLSDKTPTGSQTISTFRTQAQSNGTGYDLLSFYPLLALQCLYVIKYKNLNSQIALGQGYTKSTNASGHVTGGTNTLSMYYGDQTGITQVKFAGVEDLWGNQYQLLEGYCTNSSRNILTAFKNFNDTGSGYIDNGKGATADLIGCMRTIQGNTETGFIPKTVASTPSSIYYCDWVTLSRSVIFSFGGAYAEGNNAGIFDINPCYIYSTSSDVSMGSRLMYL